MQSKSRKSMIAKYDPELLSINYLNPFREELGSCNATIFRRKTGGWFFVL